MKTDPTTHLSYESDLNPGQFAAVSHSDGPVLIIAGAGSGKTRTIVYRVAWLVEHGHAPESILLLTFTRKAAEQMLERAADLLDTRISGVSGGTFHSTGNLLLRKYAHLVGFNSSFSIMDQSDSIEAIDHAKSMAPAPTEDRKKLPKSRTISAIISKAVSTGTDTATVLEKDYSHFLEFADFIEQIRKLYEQHKRANNLMDYDDLLVNTIRLLEDHDDIRTRVSERWTHILVDEYQDTNALQARIVRLLAYTHDNVMVVGDDSQSIYSFRGANFTNIMEFPKLFPGAEIIRLEQNYRSTAPILRVTNSIIEGAQVGYPKRLFTDKTGGPLPLAAKTGTERDQSKFVIRCIAELHQHGIPLRDIAVLFRAGFHSFDLEGELARNRVPFVKYGGLKLLESLHIKDVLAHLKVLSNPRDRLSWGRVLRILPGVGVKTAAKLAGRFSEEGIPENPTGVGAGYKKFGADLEALFRVMVELKAHDGPVSEKVDKINQYYFPHLKENYDNYPKRMRDLDHLADLAAPYRSLGRFLNEMALDPPEGESEDSFAEGDNLVLSTIHSAKGLEWHTVILIWMAEGRLPSGMALNSPEELEEERRLLYVAATRAKHNLVIVAPTTFFDRQKGYVPVKFSRFLVDVPEDYFRTHRE
jgi:DNA helicase II / ATP-dependent DNA helicase PcrA